MTIHDIEVEHNIDVHDPRQVRFLKSHESVFNIICGGHKLKINENKSRGHQNECHTKFDNNIIKIFH